MKKEYTSALLVALIVLMAIPAYAEPQPWDALRPVSQTADNFSLPIELLALAFSVGLTLVAFLAYQRKSTTRFLMLFSAFALFSLKWVIMIVDEFISPGHFISRASVAVLDIASLLLLFWAIYQSA
jgi:hypothetical protein